MQDEDNVRNRWYREKNFRSKSLFIFQIDIMKTLKEELEQMK